MHLLQWWHSWGRLAAIIAGSFVGVVLLFVLFCFYTPPGHAVLASLIEPLSGNSVAIKDLSGTLPHHIHAKEVELRDVNGTWLKVEGVALDWHFFSLIGNRVNAADLRADRVIVLRRKVPSKTTSTSTTTIDVDHIAIGRIELEPAVLGRPAVLTASGSLHYASRHDVAADLTIRRLDGPGRYDIHAAIVYDIARGTITVAEGGAGLAGGAIGMPDLGPLTLNVQASAQGSLNMIRFKAGADLLDVFGGGSIDLASNQADIDFSAVAPEMHPNKQLSWTAVSVKGHLHGAFATPEITADLKIAGLNSSGTRIGMLTAALRGHAGKADLEISAADLHLPGEKANVFGATPVLITAHVDLVAPDRPVRFAVTHPFLKLAGNSTTRVPLAGKVTVSLPSLGALSGLIGTSLAGDAALALNFKQSGPRTELTANGTIAVRGTSSLAKLLGGNAKLTATASLQDAQNLTAHASLKGAATTAQLSGSITNGTQAFSGDLAISDLARVVASLTGSLKLNGRLAGPQNNGNLWLDGAAQIATKGMSRQLVTFEAKASGLPKLKTADAKLVGRFAGAPISLRANVAPAGPNAMKITLSDAVWRSARAQGAVVVAGTKPKGSIALRVARLADFAPLIGTTLAGSFNVKADFETSTAVLHASVHDLVSGTTQMDRINLDGSIADPLGKPVLALNIGVPQVENPSLAGSATAKLNGPLDAVAIALSSEMTTTGGQDFTITVNAMADTTAKHVTIGKFDGAWQGQTVTLASPATIDYANGLKFAAAFVEGKSMHLAVDGNVPSDPRQSMLVRANGTADLGVLLANLASVGQSVRGKIALNATVTGSTAQPRVVGEATLTGGQIQDYSQGLNLTNVEATATAQGSAIRLTKFTATAGPGTISGTGLVDLSTPGMPVDITFTARSARPITSDLITATLNSNLKLQGHLADGMRLSGTINIREANINIPEKFASSVATLNVRRAHQKPGPPPSGGSARVALDLTVTSQGQIFVRGRGLEAEFEGSLKVAGTTATPQVQGGLDMRRGTFSLAGTNLTFQSGKISFNGAALHQKLDPSLDFVAQTEANGITATLKITGTASQPKIELTSSPQMPQDEILAQLLFQQSAKSLSAMQLASVAQAAATLGGGGGGFDPVGAVRKSLGLDRLAVGSTQGANGSSGSTTVEAGKYVLRNVYLAARQDMSGGTRALVQVDISKHLKAQAVVNTGARAATTTSTPLQDNGDSIGLSYQFEY